MTKTFRKVRTDLENTYIEKFSKMSNKELVADFRAKKAEQNSLVAVLSTAISELTPFNVYRKELDKRGIDYLEVLHNPEFVPVEPDEILSFKEYVNRFWHIPITEDQSEFLWSLSTEDINYLYPGTRNYLENLCIEIGFDVPSYTENKKAYFSFYDDLLTEGEHYYSVDIHQDMLEKVLRKSFDAFIKFYNEDRNEV